MGEPEIYNFCGKQLELSSPSGTLKYFFHLKFTYKILVDVWLGVHELCNDC